MVAVGGGELGTGPLAPSNLLVDGELLRPSPASPMAAAPTATPI